MPSRRVLASFVVAGLVFTCASAHAESSSSPPPDDERDQPAASDETESASTSDEPSDEPADPPSDPGDAPAPGECGSETDLSACFQCCAASHAEGLRTLYSAYLGCLSKGRDCVSAACAADADCADFQTCLDESQCSAKH